MIKSHTMVNIPNKRVDLPCLMVSKHNPKLIVLMISKQDSGVANCPNGKGIVLDCTPGHGQDIGYISETWDMNSFVLLDEQLVMENKYD